MKFFFIVFIFIAFSIHTKAQELVFSKSAGSDSTGAELDQGNDLVIDGSGNIFVTGIMSNWTTGSIFGQGEANQTVLNVNGAFIAKYNSNGSLEWAKQIEANNNGVVSNAIALDDNNNIYITGYFYNQITFGVGTATQTTFISAGFGDIFFAKYSSNGDFIWAKTFGGSEDDNPGGNDIEIDSNNNIYITGSFNNATVFGQGEANETTLTGNQLDIFLAKYNSNGNLIWVQKSGGDFGDGGKNLDMNSNGDIFLTGNFYNSSIFGESLTNQTELFGNTEAAFIAKYNNNGVFQWAKGPFYLNGPGSSISGDIKVINDNKIVYTGSYFSQTFLSECVWVDGNSEDMIVIQYDTDGNYIWNNTLMSDSFNRGISLDVDSNGNIYATGYFSEEAVLNEDKCNEIQITSMGEADIYVVAYDINGQLLGVTTAGSNNWDQASGIAVNNNGNIHITGFYRNNIVFGLNEPNETTLLKNGFNEIFVSKYFVDLNATTGTMYAGESNCIEICSNSDPIDLFDILLNNPDSGGIWSPALVSGTGIFDPTIDSSGIYRYIVSESNCISDYAEITVNFNGQANAGNDTLVNICSEDTPFNLFDLIGGNPDSGGVWSPSLTSNSDVFDPAVDSAGVYTYTVSKTGCIGASSLIEVNIDVKKDAGENGSIVVCENSSNFNLFDILNGNPQDGGTWTPLLASGTGMFNPTVDESGIYIYTINNVACELSVSEVQVTVSKLANAGENGELNICVNNASVDLYDGLLGMPDMGGTWTPALASGTGRFDPTIDVPGVYTYTVSKANCGLDTSEVNVSISNIEPITDYEIKIKGLSNSNSIEVIINSNLDYKFSLDGINYQYSNVFNNLSGGNYNIYVKEINGCGILEEVVTIFGYPKFFTPNNDGHNDFWELKGVTDEEFSIYIYDRYGKLLKHLISPQTSWDGTFNGFQMPSDDYWFKLIFNDGIIKSGHFTLKR